VRGRAQMPSRACSSYASFARENETLCMHMHFRPGDYMVISRLKTKNLSVNSE